MQYFELGFIQKIKNRIYNLQPAHFQIARNMAWVALFVFIGKLAGAAKEMAIAYRFGVGEVVDTYNFVFTIITWLPTVWQSVIMVILVPLFARLSEEEKRAFYAELVGFSLIVGGLLTIMIIVGLPLVAPYVFSNLSEQAAGKAVTLAKGLAPIALINVFAGLIFARLLAEERHTNTLMETLPALCILIAVLFWPNISGQQDVTPLLYGSLIGFVVYVVCLWLMLTRSGITSRPRWTMRSPAWRAVWHGMGYMALGQAIITFANPIDQVMAANLGEGAISTLGYANRVLALLLGLGATTIGRAVLPVLSGAAAQPKNAWHIAQRWSKLLFLVGFCGVILAWWLAPLGIRFLFERGAFSAADSTRVVEVFRYGLFQVPFYLSGIVYVQMTASLRRYDVIFMSGIIGLISKVFVNWTAIAFIGLPGIMLGTTAMHLANFVYFNICLRTILGGANEKTV